MDPMKLQLKLMSVLGLDPRKPNYILAITNALVLALATVLIFGGVAFDWESLKTLGNADYVPCFVQQLITGYYILYHKEKWINMLETINTLKSLKTHDLQLQRIRKISRRVQIVIAAVPSLCLLGIYGSVITGVPIMQFMKLCDTQRAHCRVSLLLFQAHVMNVTTAGTVFYNLFFIQAITLILCELKCTREDFGRLDFVEMDWIEIRAAIERHSNILSITDMFTEAQSGIIFVYYWACTLSICMYMFLMTLDGLPPPIDELFKLAIFIFSYSCVMGIPAVAGTLLMTEGENIAETIYTTNWWQHKGYKSNMLMVLMRAQKPISLSLGGLGYMTVARYPKVFQRAFSLYTLMTTILQQDNEM